MFYKIAENKNTNIICNIPHSSTAIPKEFLDSYSISKKELRNEILSLADLYTDTLYKKFYKNTNYILSKVSRILVDIERFYLEKDEPMSKVGMSALYTKTQYGNTLRKISAGARIFLIKNVYKKYHSDLTTLVEKKIKSNGNCLIVDLHSFPSVPRKYESDKDKNRPDICIGTDSFHTPLELKEILKKKFSSAGYSVKYDSPFSGSIVPMKFYKKNKEVSSIMIEVNRKLYMNEKTFKKTNNFKKVSNEICDILNNSIKLWEENYGK